MQGERQSCEAWFPEGNTGKRQARPNPESEWVTQEVPELHILDGDLWNAAKARQAAIKYTRSDDGETENHFRERRRPKRELHRRRHCCHPVEAVDHGEDARRLRGYVCVFEHHERFLAWPYCWLQEPTEDRSSTQDRFISICLHFVPSMCICW